MADEISRDSLMSIVGGGDETQLRSPAASQRNDARSPHDWIGRVLKDQYRLEERLGGGGMGDVYLARDLLAEANQDPDPFVAVKVLSAALRGDTEATRGLQREARRAQQLSHENIVRVHYFGCDGDTYYLTMELLRGTSFEQVIRRYERGLPLDEALPLISGMCLGLSYAHRAGIVHSDVKPSNVFLTSNNVVKLLDFGIAMPLRWEGGSAAHETRYNPRRLGALTPGYSPVELYLGLGADPRDDVFSAACVIYELLAGRHPYDKMEAPQALEEKRTPAAIHGLTRGQNRALQHALALRREDRLAGLDGFLAEFTAAERPRMPPMWGLAAAGILAVGAATAWFVTRPASEGRPNGAQTTAANTVAPAQDRTSAIDAAPSPAEARTPVEAAPPRVDAATPVEVAAPPAASTDASDENCENLESQWARMSCDQRRACFEQRAADARVAASIADENLKPMYAAREEMYQSLQRAACGEQANSRDRQYDSFRRKFPGYPVR